ncbi:MAG: hypothetical protein A2X11_15290 [Bacteroidetes bacterium GWE2_42_24]|nr:MAG: hypothetical protein A2X11_15290 [Bacteroidetes bacterium GWE2_42_24]OFY31743.1 MAG: hypothetical protein A2X09_09035 [Bacteroidetes bacterium GWF2_43_11]
MSKTGIIIRREYLTRVKKKSFFIMTIIGPLLMAALWIVPFFIATLTEKQRDIEIYDQSGVFRECFRTNGKFNYIFIEGSLDSLKRQFLRSGHYAMVYIPRTELSVPQSAYIYSSKQPGLNVKSEIRDLMKKEVEALKLIAKGIDPEVLEAIKTNINVGTIILDENGFEKKGSAEVTTALGLVAGIVIYFMLFMFGGQVMRSVIEEKTSRIVEVIVSSVKPVQLMLGKMIGVGLVGLTQFLLWVLLTFGLVTGFQLIYGHKLANGSASATQTIVQAPAQGAVPAMNGVANFGNDNQMLQILEDVRGIDFGTMLICFLLYFVGGYLLYASLFAAMGSAVENEQDSQQFILPVTLPLVIALFSVGYILNYPDGSLSVWLSMIPLTSPVVMMIRIAFGVHWTQVALSVVILYLSLALTTWLGARIYRTGILMYGKKVTWRELWKWLRYKS